MSTSSVSFKEPMYSGFHLTQSLVRLPSAYGESGFLMMTPSCASSIQSCANFWKSSRLVPFYKREINPGQGKVSMH